MDFDIEFSKQVEREKLHALFTRNTVAMQILALCAMAVIMVISGGGTSPAFMIFAFVSCVAALFSHFLLVSKNILRGGVLFGSVLLFLPAIIYFAVDALAISPFPWRAEYALALMSFPFIVFFIAQQQNRDTGTQRVLSLFTLITYFAVSTVGFFYALLSPYDAGTRAGEIQMPISEAVLGFFSNTGTAGSVFILIFFSALMFCLRPHAATWERLLSGYICSVAAGAIFLMRDGAVWLGILAGLAGTLFLLVHKRTHRIAAIVAIAAGAIFVFAEADFNKGVFLKIPQKISATNVDEGSEKVAENSAESVERVLPQVAISIFADNPVFGSGAGTFSAEFDARATEPQWQLSPRTAGSLYLTVLAENGIVGFLLLFVPAAFLIVRGFRTCARTPHYEAIEERQEFGKPRQLADERVVLAGTLCGIVGVAVVFAFHYLEFSPALAVYLAVFGGIAARESRVSKREIFEIAPTRGNARKAVFAFAFIVPASLLLLALPIFFAEKKYTSAHDSLSRCFSSEQTGLPSKDISASELDEAIQTLITAIDIKKNHADAWCAIASAYTLACHQSPEKSGAFSHFIAKAAAHAVEIAPKLASAHIASANASIMLGDVSAAKKSLSVAESLAPQNVPILLQIAEIYRLIPGEEKKALEHFRRLAILAKNSAHVRQVEALLLMSESENSPSNAAPTGTQNDDAPKFVPEDFKI